MNIYVSDEQVIVNIQGIRYVTWGESTTTYLTSAGKPWYLSVTYKGNHQSFSYRTENEARAMFNKLRVAMDKSLKDKNANAK